MGSDVDKIEDYEFYTGFDQNDKQKMPINSNKIICKDSNGDLVEKKINKKGEI